MFLCTVPASRATRGGFRSLNAQNFAAMLANRGLQHEFAKLRCILVYFRDQPDFSDAEMQSPVAPPPNHPLYPPPLGTQAAPSETQVGHRLVSTGGHRSPDGADGLWIFRVNLTANGERWGAREWAQCDKPLSNVRVDDSKIIDDFDRSLQVDFANAYIGGGALSGGCVQEEIRFTQCPDLAVTCLVCEVMRDDEAIIIRGGARYSKTRGYAFQMAFDGPFTDPQPVTPFLTAIDACDYRGWAADVMRHQLEHSTMLRELEKARAGFSIHYFEDARDFLGACGGNQPRPGSVATGHWGCGAFLGNKELKALLQWMAASACGMDLEYATFGDQEVARGLVKVAKALRGATVGQLWNALAALSQANAVALQQPGAIFQAVVEHFPTSRLQVNDMGHGVQSPVATGKTETVPQRLVDQIPPSRGKEPAGCGFWDDLIAAMSCCGEGSK